MFVIIFSFIAAVTLDMDFRNQSVEQTLVANINFPEPMLISDKITTLNNEVYCVVGESENPSFNNTVKTLTLIKKPYFTVTSLSVLDTKVKLNSVLLTNTSYSNEDIKIINEIIEKGSTVIFTDMPDLNSLKNKDLLSLLGIASIGKKEEQKSILSIKGFLIGGLKFFDDAITNAYNVSLESSCKIFVRADKKGVDNQKQNVLIWRNYVNNVPVFVFNNSFLYSDEGIGCLVSVLSLNEDVFVYPIIGSISVELINFPMNNKFDSEAHDIFGRDTFGALRDIIFPDLIFLSSKTGIRFSFTYNNEGEHINFWKDEMIKHRFFLYENSSNKIDIVTKDGFKKYNNTDFVNSSLITGLGFVHYVTDINDIFNSNVGYDWRALGDSFSSELFEISEIYPWIEKLTLNQTIKALNDYYSVKPQITVFDDMINIRCENFSGNAVFIVRIKDDKIIQSTEGAEVYKIEDGVFKLTISEPDIFLKLVRQVKK